MASIEKKTEPKIIKPLDPKDFDTSKVSFSSEIILNCAGFELKHVYIKYCETQFFVVARNCKIMLVTKETDKYNKNLYMLRLHITDENFIKMVKSFDELLNLTGYTNRASWFNNNELTIDDTMQILKPTLSYHPTYGYSIASSTSFDYQNSNQITKDCLLFEKYKIVDVCFSFNRISINQNKFYCRNTIEKIQKIK